MVPIQNVLALSKIQYVPNQIVVNFKPETGVIQARTVKGEVITNIASVTALCKEVKAYGMVREFPDFKPGSSDSKFEGLESEAQIRSGVPDLSRYYVVTFDESMGLKEVMEKFKTIPM